MPIPISPAELARIERFVAAYNQLDDFLQQQMPSPSTFRGALDFYASRHRFWRDAETLRVFAALRNFLIHEKTQPFDYPCVPSEAATAEIERICAELTRPITLGDGFCREVVTLSPGESLERALELIARRGISRFPIYDGPKFVGFLTESGIARFLAQCIAGSGAFNSKTPIREVLTRETRRRNLRFADPQVPLSQAAAWFHEETFLEAVLIAENGDETRPLRGILTRGDVAGIG